MAALREVAREDANMWSRRRVVAGVLLGLAGVATLGAGLFADVPEPAVVVGTGAATTFLAVAVLGPLFAGSLAKAIGAPIRGALGVVGTLARENAARSPKRTSATASALMIGIALVSMMSVLAASTKASAAATLEANLKADFIITGGSTAGPGAPISGEVARRLARSPEVGAVTPVRWGEWRDDGARKGLAAVDAATVDETVALGIEEGTVDDLRDGGVFLSREAAESLQVDVGDELAMEFADTGSVGQPVEGIFSNQDIIGAGVVMSLETYERNFADRLDFMVFATAAPGAATDDARAAIEEVTAAFPGIQVSDQSEFRERQEQSIDQVLGLVTALLGLALVIALLGITNTLALSVFERTRELGLLRAVGMARRQARAMIRWESVIIAVIGALLGLVVGTLFGWALVRALAADGITELAVPGGQLVGYVIAAALAGILAGMPPARRAARLDVLRAVATE
jgi:putative ABC transport system permease protein